MKRANSKSYMTVLFLAAASFHFSFSIGLSRLGLSELHLRSYLPHLHREAIDQCLCNLLPSRFGNSCSWRGP